MGDHRRGAWKVLGGLLLEGFQGLWHQLSVVASGGRSKAAATLESVLPPPVCTLMGNGLQNQQPRMGRRRIPPAETESTRSTCLPFPSLDICFVDFQGSQHVSACGAVVCWYECVVPVATAQLLHTFDGAWKSHQEDRASRQSP